MSNKIHIPARKVKPNGQGVIKITPEAMEILVEITNESCASMREIASQIIVQVAKNNLIVYDRKEE